MTLPIQLVVSASILLSPPLLGTDPFGRGLLIGSSINNRTAPNELFAIYRSPEAVKADYGVETPEYRIAQRYFAQIPRPKSLMIATVTGETGGGDIATLGEYPASGGGDPIFYYGPVVDHFVDVETGNLLLAFKINGGATQTITIEREGSGLGHVLEITLKFLHGAPENDYLKRLFDQHKAGLIDGVRVSVWNTRDGQGEVSRLGYIKKIPDNMRGNSPDSMGAIAAPAGTLSVIKSPVFGWASVTNASPMAIGKLREKDSALRLRRTASVSKGNRNMVESLEAALRDLTGVIEARVLENASHVTDSNGLLPHSIHAVVLGGDDAAIASTIWARKTGGSPLIGSTAINILDINDHPQTVRFSRPTDVRVMARVTVSPRTGWTIAKPAQIKNALTAWVAESQTVGDELANSELYTPLNTLGGFVTTSIELARFGQPLTEQNLSMLFYERASLDIADIEVVVT